MLERGRQVFDVEIKGLEAVRGSLDESFVRAVRLILETVRNGGIAVVSGVGKNLTSPKK